MALRLDWSSLDTRACYVMSGDGFVINNYGHPSFLRYIEGNRLLTLSYHYVHETAERGKRFLFLRNYAIHVQIPTELAWDSGIPLTSAEAKTVLDRICQTFEKCKRRPCRIAVNDKLYAQLAASDRLMQPGRQ